MTLQAPFPYFGGKRRLAAEVWARFGEPDVYLEPFFGSGAVLLANPEPAAKEVVWDLNGFICNVWRAIKQDPEAVASWADYPTVHQDLTARHKWLIAWAARHHDRLIADPDCYDVQAAGW